MPDLDADRVIESAQSDDGTGFCLECGEERDGCEPDARNYECYACGKMRIFGAEEILMMGGGIL